MANTRGFSPLWEVTLSTPADAALAAKQYMGDKPLHDDDIDRFSGHHS